MTLRAATAEGKDEDTRRGWENFRSEFGQVWTSEGKGISEPQRRKREGFGHVTEKLTHIDSWGNSHFGWQIGLRAATADRRRISATALT